MKITIISLVYPYPQSGVLPGVERYIGNLSTSLRDLGHNVKIVTTFSNGGKKRENYNGIEILRIKDYLKIFNTIPYLNLLLINRIIFGIKIYRPKHFKFFHDSDIIFINTPLPFSRIFTIINKPSIPILFHFPQFPDNYYIKRSMIKLHKKVIAISKETKKNIVKYFNIPKEGIKVIPCGVELKKFNPNNYSVSIRKKYGKKIILYSGLMIPRKNVPILLKSMVYVLKELPDAQLILTGSGHLLEDYKKLALTYNIEKNTHFLGYVKDTQLKKLFATSDIFVFPSKLEGFGQVIIEALASGTPVICSNIPPMAQIVENAGHTSQINDSKDLSKEIITLLTNKDLYQKLKENTLQVASEYAWSNIARIYETYIKNIVKNTRN
jgi:glycosyltransferase involved in cell wall biosynthesis